jgi:predicted RND superfamily exporter protein
MKRTARDRVEAGFVRWGHLVSRHARLTIAAALALGLVLGFQLPRLKVEAGSDAFLHPDDPVRVSYDLFRAQFGRDNVILMAVRPPEIFDLGFLERLRALHLDLERSVAQLDQVTSLINARHSYGRGDELVVEDLLAEWPRDAADLDVLRERALSNPLYRNLLISGDGRATAVLMEMDTWSSRPSELEAISGFEDSPDPAAPDFLSGDEVFAIVDAVRQVMERHDAPGFELYLTGGPAFEATLMTAMQRDILVFVSLSVLIIALLLFVLFRRPSGVILPLLVVALSVVCTIGSMALAGVPMTLPVQVLPSLLLAIGVCGAVHVLTLFFRSIGEGVGREEAIARALGHSGLAVLLTSLTTAGGLASFASAALTPVAHFGVFGPIGVGFALLFTLTLLPALLVVAPLGSRSGSDRSATRWLDRRLGRPLDRSLDRFLIGAGVGALRRPRAVLLVTAALILLAIAGASRLRFSHDSMPWLPEDEPVRVATELVDRLFAGTQSMEALIETGIENGLHDPSVLRRLEQLRAWSESFQRGELRVGKTVSVADVLKEIHQALNENRPEYYAIPGDRRLIAQEFLLFENAGSDDLEEVVDSRFSMASFTFRVPWADAVDDIPFIAEIESHFRQVMGEDARVTMTGGMVVMGRTFHAIIVSMARSYAIAFLVVAPLMVLLLGSLRGGLISMIPNLTPVLLTLGLMGWLDYPLDISTMMIGAVVLSVAVDDTIHLAHNFLREVRASGDPDTAIRRTLETTGRALLFTSIVLTAGFLINTFATMGNLVNLGVFTSFAVATAFLADLLIAPPLLKLVAARGSQPVGTPVPAGQTSAGRPRSREAGD